jgi:Domain of unknown function (DUF1707)
VRHRTQPAGPASYLTLERGTDVLDRFGAPVGSVERVLIGPGTHFDGVIVETPVGRRFVDAPEVRRIETARVHLSLTRADVEYPGEPRVLGAYSARWGERTEVTEEDRQALIDALKFAYVQDGLTVEELAHRVDRAYTAETFDELQAALPPDARGAA